MQVAKILVRKSLTNLNWNYMSPAPIPPELAETKVKVGETSHT